MKRMMKLFCAMISLIAALLPAFVARADAPSVIRVGVPGIGIGNRPVVGGSSTATVHLRGLLEEEFAKDGIKIQWSFLRGAGPAVNELFANGLADFGFGLGDLPSIIGRAGGLRTRLLAAASRYQNTYLAVPADSPLKSVRDLRGKKVAIFKGTNIQLAIAKILEANGLTEKDIRALNMDTATAKSALTTKDVDAVFANSDFLALRDQGVARIVYTSKDDDPRFFRQTALIGSEDFIERYPEITKRVVRVVVQASKWLGDQEANPNPVYMLWTKSGVQFSNYQEDFAGSTIKLKSSPLLDEYFLARYRVAIDDAKRFGLIRKTFDEAQWVDRSFLDAVLKELALESYWTPYDASGQPKPAR
jgi:sulfonate transport system substrate-binding protein